MKSWVFGSRDDPGGWREIDPGTLPGEPVHVEVTHSALNYKDALSLTGRAPISRVFPMVPGIDLVGTVLSDESNTFVPGDVVIATGHGLGERFWGAYSQQARLRPEWLIRLPSGMAPLEAAAFGTPGVTAAIALAALESHGIRPGQGPVLVTGASGGVGTFASLLLKHAGYEIAAATGRDNEDDYLRANGATEIIRRAELEGEPRPLGKERWRAAIDVAGGRVLANILSSITYSGAVAACGLAGSMDLPTSVAPFILRGVSLLGIDSVMAPADIRQRAWARLAEAKPTIAFDTVVTRHRFGDVAGLAEDLIAQRLRGRAVLDW